MNESMLQSLMQLFAIIASINRNVVFVLARNFVETYLNQQLSKKLAEKYLAVFEYYFNEIESPERSMSGKKTSLLSVKILSICQEINKEFHIWNRFQILLSLLQFNKYFEESAPVEAEFTQSISDAVKTISDGLLIRDDEFLNCKAFITDRFYKVPNKERILVISDDRSFRFTEIKHYQRDNLSGQIFVLRIKRAETYLFYYDGRERLELNGKYIYPRHVYLLPKGSSIRGKGIYPLYYSDIASSFHKDASKEGIAFLAEDIHFLFRNSDNGIHKFSFKGESGQLVGIMGGSGTGKSTLLKVFNGSLKLDGGTIYINGYNIKSKMPELNGIIGYIPQDDLLIEDLTVYQNLYFNSRLCLDNLTSDETWDLVNNLLTELDLFEIRDLKVGSPLNKFISGGQRKRLNIALELIREPYILFVDEPTSGLSSVDSENVMFLLKEQAVKGKLIVVNIHQPSSDLFKMFDRLLILDKGGYPAYFGNPVEAIIYFKQMTERVDSAESECPACGNTNPDEILQIIEARDVNEYGDYSVSRKIKPVEWYNMYLRNIQSKLKFDTIKQKLPANPFKVPNLVKQFSIFSKRNMLAKFADIQFMLIALLVSPMLALILGYFTKYISGTPGNIHAYIFSKNENIPAYLFMSVIVALFLGMIVSADEIIKDGKVLARESFLNLSRTSYLLAKVGFLFLLSGFQMITFVMIGNAILQIRGMTFSYWLILFSTACFANLVGLNISDGLKSVVAIYIIVPFLLVPQILLAGVIVKFDKLHYRVASQEAVPAVGDLMASRWAYEALAVDQFRNNTYQEELFEIEKAESNVAYELQYLVPAITEKLGDTEQLTRNDPGGPVIKKNIGIIINSINDAGSLPCKVFVKNSPDPYGEFTWMARLRTCLENSKQNLAAKRDELAYAKDAKIGEMIKKYGGREELIRLKQDYYNDKLADLLLNTNELHKVYESPDKFIRKMEPVYQEPAFRNGRAQFFSSVKILGSQEINTVCFNVLAIWLMTVILYIALQFSWLRKLILLVGSHRR